ncbi:MAG TPA: DUF6485 family protein [Candidatus Brocadiia bacterium]|nr:DUF6485 family protein [Candidatus Brocadiia bacterium]
MKCKIDENKEKCPCKYTDCERHGACCECVRYHLSTRSLPMCMRGLDWLRVTDGLASR